MNTDLSTSIIIVIRNSYLPKRTHIDGVGISDIEIKVTKVMELKSNRIILQEFIPALYEIYKNQGRVSTIGAVGKGCHTHR
ncbi:MAG: hypothetical protein ACTS8P_05030 [Arsenophonus sp. NC-XBC3-MAG3]